MQIKVITLGAGQDVGRSCVVVTFGGKTFMFDCGMHMGYRDHRRYPDFKLLSHTANFTDLIDAVFITHFHLDHCGALPYFTEVLGYDGPIYMSSPTRALVPVMLEDYHRVLTERKGQAEAFTRQQIQDCMRKVTVINLHQTIQLDADCELKAFYAGHVLGAAMFHVRVAALSVVYTGDYNMTPDRHIGNARVECLRPDLLITESTYATTLRDSKRTQERDFLSAVHDTVNSGAKVLIPVFAVGRAQELLLLLREHWERMNLQVPIYFSTGMAAKANLYYSLLLNWSSQAVQHVALQGKDPFGFTHVKPWHRSLTHAPGPCVLFATPGMLHGGTSLEVFKAWAWDPRNLVVLPGYCISGTVGNKLMCGVTKGLKLGEHETMDVKCQIRYLSFSAHTDLKGILTLLRQCRPQHVMLVHGEKMKMEFLKDKIIRTFGMSCYAPANNSILRLSTRAAGPIRVSAQLLDECLKERARAALQRPVLSPLLHPPNTLHLEGILLAQQQPNGAAPKLRLMAASEVPPLIGAQTHTLSYSCNVPVQSTSYPNLSHDTNTPETHRPRFESHGQQSAFQAGLLGSKVSVGGSYEEMEEDVGGNREAGEAREEQPTSAENAGSDGRAEEECWAILRAARESIQKLCPLERVKVGEYYLSVRSFHAKLWGPLAPSDSTTPSDELRPAAPDLHTLAFNCSWTHEDQELGEGCVSALNKLDS